MLPLIAEPAGAVLPLIAEPAGAVLPLKADATGAVLITTAIRIVDKIVLNIISKLLF